VGFALVGTFVLLKIVDLITGVRVPEEHEIEGLDITQHGEELITLSRRKSWQGSVRQGAERKHP